MEKLNHYDGDRDASLPFCGVEERLAVLKAEKDRLSGDNGFSLEECRTMLAENHFRRVPEKPL